MFLPNVIHIEWWMTGLNSKDTSKDFFHDQKVREEVSGGTSFLWHPARYWTAGGGGEGKIKGGFDPQLRGLQF